MPHPIHALLAPFWAAQIFTGAKSFIDNPLLGSRRLNALGLHAARVRAASALTRWRRAGLASHITPEDRERFERDGVVEIRDFLPLELFQQLRHELLDFRGAARETVQGDAITRRIAIDIELQKAAPGVRHFVRHPRWRGLARYVASFNMEPLLYLQSILPHRHDAPPDPQLQFHADTFHPAMKAWFFLNDVSLEQGPFAYVRGSHRLTPERLAWEKSRSLTARDGSCRLSGRGSLRIGEQELEGLGLPQPTIFAVPANTLIVADTFGFHARSPASTAEPRIEIWAYSRHNPFRPLRGLNMGSLPGIAERRIGWRWRLADMASGLVNQPWRAVGLKRAADD